MELLHKMVELEDEVKRIDPTLVLRRGPRNESLEVMGRVESNNGDPAIPLTFGNLAVYVADRVRRLCLAGRATYWSTGCNANAATYAVTFSLLPPPKDK